MKRVALSHSVALAAVVLVASSIKACKQDERSDGGLPTDQGPAGADASSTGDGASRSDAFGQDAGAGGISGAALFGRLAGLWSGPATMTRLGTFPMVNMDFRAADPRVLFARVDLDPDDSLRFAFMIETLEGHDVLVFRNGGQFRGIDRDTRTVLVEAEDTAGRYRFCALRAMGGCGYVDATFTFSAADRMRLHVLVRGEEHETWNADRIETRTLPQPFPQDLSPIGNGTSPFPPMPAIRATVSWRAPLAGEALVWLLLSTQPCSLGSPCALSRTIAIKAPLGATQAVITIPQMHAGDYKATAVVDRTSHLGTTFAPGRGDGLSLPNASVTVPTSGTLDVALPIAIEL